MNAFTAYRDMTPTALACRADEINDDFLVCDILGNDDERELTIYFQHVDCELDPTDYGYQARATIPGIRKEIIGATVGRDVLDRYQLRNLIGDRAVATFETAWEYA